MARSPAHDAKPASDPAKISPEVELSTAAASQSEKEAAPLEALSAPAVEGVPIPSSPEAAPPKAPATALEDTSMPTAAATQNASAPRQVKAQEAKAARRCRQESKAKQGLERLLATPGMADCRPPTGQLDPAAFTKLTLVWVGYQQLCTCS